MKETIEIYVIFPKHLKIHVPQQLLEEIEKCKTDLQVKQVGTEWCIQQSKELVKFGAPCLHFYTMGASESTREVASKVF